VGLGSPRASNPIRHSLTLQLLGYKIHVVSSLACYLGENLLIRSSNLADNPRIECEHVFMGADCEFQIGTQYPPKDLIQMGTGITKVYIPSKNYQVKRKNYAICRAL